MMHRHARRTAAQILESIIFPRAARREQHRCVDESHEQPHNVAVAALRCVQRWRRAVDEERAGVRTAPEKETTCRKVAMARRAVERRVVIGW